MADGRTAPSFELTNKPWFGPKQRAKAVLEAHRKDVLAPGAPALVGLSKILGTPLMSAIQHVRFIDFRMNGKFRYTIALCWTDSRESARDNLFASAMQCVMATGWYPLPQGERLQSVRNAQNIGSGASLPCISDGRLRGISAASNSADDGTAVRVHLDDDSSILLDAGFGRSDIRSASDRLVLLSHSHRDHIGGVERDKLASLPAALSIASAVTLEAQGRLARIRRRHSTSLLQPGRVYPLGKNLRLTPYSVPHMPGSVGYLLDDGGRVLLYTGDIALSSARHDVVQDLLSVLPPGREATVLLDATMAGRQEGVSMAEPGRWVVEQAQDRVIAITATSDHLLYAYLDVFHTVKTTEPRNEVNFVVSPSLKPVFRVLHDAFIRRDIDAMDRFLTGQYGATMGAWGESRWLYWFDGPDAIPSGPQVWFVTPDELASTNLPSEAAAIPIGRTSIPDHVLRTAVLDTSPWTGHSDQASLVAGIRRLESAGCSVVLFHNFRRRLTTFGRRHALASSPLESVERAL